MNDEEALLRQRVDQFVQELTDSLSAVVPLEEARFRIEGRRGPQGPILTIRQFDELGIPLLTGGELLFRLQVRLQCAWSAAASAEERYLAISSST